MCQQSYLNLDYDNYRSANFIAACFSPSWPKASAFAMSTRKEVCSATGPTCVLAHGCISQEFLKIGHHPNIVCAIPENDGLSDPV
jgi:hypothetical protein